MSIQLRVEEALLVDTDADIAGAAAPVQQLPGYVVSAGAINGLLDSLEHDTLTNPQTRNK